MNRFMRVFWSSVVTVLTILLVVNDVVCHDYISANVNRMEQMSDNDSVQFQQSDASQPITYNATKTIIDKRNVLSNKDRFDNDKIVFDFNKYKPNKPTTPPAVASMKPIAYDRITVTFSPIISDATPKTNDTNQEYVSRSNGEYRFR